MKEERMSERQRVFQEIANELRLTGSVRVRGFGTFSARPTEARLGRNPKTGEQISIPPSHRVSFKAAKTLKEIF